MPYAVAVDIGGTFTDLVAYDADDPPGRSTPRARPPTATWLTACSTAFAKAKLEPRAASFVNHGTTLVINALIQRKGAKAALWSPPRASATCSRSRAATGPTRSTCTTGATSR